MRKQTGIIIAFGNKQLRNLRIIVFILRRCGGQENFFHCDKCNICLDKRLQNNHKCRESCREDLCGICFEVSMSRQPTHSVVDILLLSDCPWSSLETPLFRRQQVIIAIVSAAGPFCRECPMHTSLIYALCLPTIKFKTWHFVSTRNEKSRKN